MDSLESSQIVMALRTISESMYKGLCLKIGTPQQITFRRDVVDITEILKHKANIPDKLVKMESGSRREGFRFEDSDYDNMHWRNDYRVLFGFSQASLYNIYVYTMILCDSSESPPGFTLLWLPISDIADSEILSSCVRINGTLCISSDKYRESECIKRGIPGSTVHGPCTTVALGGVFECDSAICLVSDFWPPSASSWKDRCHSWPPPHVVDDSIRSGCHFVAIGHKLGKHADNEWRISFSQAEQKLVYAMNHAQFLTYGLLKIFLKEFNHGKSEEEKLLCSYHMKTVIFWAIQQNTIAHWCPQNLVAGFWVCFKILLKWVYEGFCPNFFIPENNMFLNKLHGEAQKKLFTQLYGLYDKGIAFLLQSPSISSYIMDVLCNPRLSVRTDEGIHISMLLRRELMDVYCHRHLGMNNLQSCMAHLHAVEQLVWSPLTYYQVITLQNLTVHILQISAFMLHDIYTNTSGGNKQMYMADKKACYMLKLAAKFGGVSELLYFAVYFYKTCRYREALSIIEMIKVKLTLVSLMHMEQLDPERYTEAEGGRFRSFNIKHILPPFIILHNNICCINELSPEHVLQPYYSDGLSIPPLILLHMLEFFSCRHVDPIRAETVLVYLQLILHPSLEELQHVHVLHRDISWEILGICQQMAGNHQAALYSYSQSLRQIPFHNLQIATRHRIQDLH